MATEGAAQVETLESMLLGRLAEAGLPDHVSDVLLAALDGPEELRAVLSAGGRSSPEPDSETLADPAGVAGVYLGSIEVEGFRARR